MSGRNYPIFNRVEACIYKSGKSWGAKDTSHVEVLVGSSSSNSHKFLEHATKKVVTDTEVIFKFYVDGIKIKEMVFSNNKGRAGDLIRNEYFNINK